MGHIFGALKLLPDLFHMRIVRRLQLTATLALATTVVACSAPPPASVLWDELLPVSGTFRGTDLISRAAPESLKALGKGWTIDTDTTIDRGFWAIGLEAQLDMVVVRDGDHELVFDVMPPDGMQSQLLSLRVNGALMEPVALGPGWSRQAVLLPEDAVIRGHNRVELTFRGVSRPSDLDPNNNDDRPLAARFRFLQLLPVGADRALGEDDPDAVASGSTPAPTETLPIPDSPRVAHTWNPTSLETDTGTQLVFEADSIVQFALAVPEEARLVGQATVVAESGERVAWVADAIDADGVVHELGRGGAGSLNADLGAFAGQHTLLRLRTIGSRRAAVVWEGLGLSDPQGEFDRAALTPPAPPAVARSGRFTDANVVIVMLDALRPDFITTYRGIAPTPAIDALALDGTRFEDARAVAPWTNQSVYSLLTGRYPEGHGVAGWRDAPARDLRTLFQTAYAAGYHTALWSEHPLYRLARALRYDLDSYIDTRPRLREEMREYLNQTSVMTEDDGRVDVFRNDKPNFVMYHLLPPHAPYEPDPDGIGWGGPSPRWADSMNKGFRTDLDITPASLQGFSRHVGDNPPDQADIDYVTARYQDNIRYADELVGKIVDGLKRSGRYDDTMIILLSDHGEAFYEHGHFLHTWPLYDEMLRIPLVIKWPESDDTYQRAVTRPVTTVDIAPTVLDALGMADEDPGYQGESLLPLVFDGFFPSRAVYASTVGVANGAGDDEPLAPMTSLIEMPYKVIHDKRSGHLELYDLESDPGELIDLAGSQPLLAQQMFQALLLQELANVALNTGADPAEIETEMDPELVERLCSLGYIRC